MITWTQSEDMRFRVNDAGKVKEWLSNEVAFHGHTVDRIRMIWMSDAGIHEMNKTYLNHDYPTDIITFDYAEGKGPLSGELFISIDRVKEQAKTWEASFRDELHRVMVHGILHLMGYTDATPEQQAEMRKAEDAALARRLF
jgi:probable rRNA maturation factor